LTGIFAGCSFARVAQINYLRSLRERRGITQVQLATLAHMAQNTISKLERGPKKAPRYNTVLALARALRVAPDTLRFGVDPRRRDLPPDARRRRPERIPKGVAAAVAVGETPGKPDASV